MALSEFSGPKAHWFFGNLKQLRRDNVRFFLNMHRDYGDVASFRLGPIKMLFVADHDIAYRVLVKESAKFIKGERFWTDLDELIGESILRIDGAPWKRKRKLYAPSFHPSAIQHYSKVMTELSKQFAAQIKSGETRDIHADMIHLTADIVCKCLFDKLPSETGIDLVKNLEETAQAIQNRRVQLLKLPHWLPTKNNRRIKQLVKEIEEVVLGYLDAEMTSNEPSKTLLSLLIHSKDENGERLGRQELRDETMTLFLAGHETTALSATWAWYELSKNPEVYLKVKHEVDTMLQGRDFTFDDVKKVPYTQAVLTESLRKYPPVPTIPRQVNETFTINDREIPKGANIIVSPYAMHYSTKFFPNPDEFLPERWLSDLESNLPKCQYMPFGAGPRICIGNTFALLEGLSILVTLTQQVEMSQPKPYTLEPRQQVTLRPIGDVPMIMQRRSVTHPEHHMNETGTVSAPC